MVKDSGSGFQLKTGTLSQPGRTDNLRSYPIPNSNLVAIAGVAPSFSIVAPFRASFLLSFRPERSAVEESLAIPDLRKAVRA